MNKSVFRSLVAFCFLWAIVANFGFYLEYLGHFGGGMTYALVESSKVVYRNVYGKEPHGHDLYLAYPKLLDQNLLIEWHDSYHENVERVKKNVAKGQAFYILSRSPELPNPAIFEANERVRAISEVAEVNFLDAPPPVFRILKAIQGLKNKADRNKIFVYKVQY